MIVRNRHNRCLIEPGDYSQHKNSTRDKADIGLFITLAPPTKAMLTEAAAAGFYVSPNGKKYARLQLLTIEGLLDGTRRAAHPSYEPDTGFKKAKAEHSGEQTTLL